MQKHNELAEKSSKAKDQQDDGWYRGWAAKVGWTSGADDKGVPEDEHLIGQHPQMNVPTADESKQHDQRDGAQGKDNTDVQADGSDAFEGQTGNDSIGAQPTDTNGSDDVKPKSKEEKKNLAAAIAQHLNAGNIDLSASAADDDTMGEFRPHILHAPHDPVPIAMVNRPPIGSELRFMLITLTLIR